MSRYAELVERVKQAVLRGAGETPPELRQAVEARTAGLAGRPPGGVGSPIPADLEAYVDKMATGAYRITDEDLEALKAAGHSEDVLFEVTVAAALGAGLGRLERGLAALEESRR